MRESRAWLTWIMGFAPVSIPSPRAQRRRRRRGRCRGQGSRLRAAPQLARGTKLLAITASRSSAGAARSRGGAGDERRAASGLPCRTRCRTPRPGRLQHAGRACAAPPETGGSLRSSGAGWVHRRAGARAAHEDVGHVPAGDDEHVRDGRQMATGSPMRFSRSVAACPRTLGLPRAKPMTSMAHEARAARIGIESSRCPAGDEEAEGRRHRHRKAFAPQSASCWRRMPAASAVSMVAESSTQAPSSPSVSSAK